MCISAKSLIKIKSQRFFFDTGYEGYMYEHYVYEGYVYEGYVFEIYYCMEGKF